LDTFHFKRGGFRIKMLNGNNSSSFLTISNMTRYEYETKNTLTELTEQIAANGFVIENMYVRPGISATIPFYYPFNMVCKLWTNEKANLFWPGFWYAYGSDSVSALTFYISTSDDFSLGWPRCPPAFNTQNTLEAMKKKKMKKENHAQMETERIARTEVPDVTSTLTQNTDLSGMTEEGESTLVSFLHPDPYMAKDTTIKSLTRFYTVADYVWTTSQGFGTAFTTLEFPSLLFTIPHNIDVLNYFKYFRSDVEIEIRLNTTTMHYGALQIAYIPCYNASEPTADIWQLSNEPNMILSANSANSLRFTIPWVGPYDWMDLEAGNWSDICGVVKMNVLQPLNCIGASGSTSVGVNIQARFLNPVLAGYSLRVAH